MNVLIIDDDLGIRETLGMALETLGHSVATVVNRAAAEKKLKAETFEVAFLDIRLGAENGLDLLPDLLRLSVGIEDPQDLIDDLGNALRG